MYLTQYLKHRWRKYYDSFVGAFNQLESTQVIIWLVVYPTLSVGGIWWILTMTHILRITAAACPVATMLGYVLTCALLLGLAWWFTRLICRLFKDCGFHHRQLRLVLQNKLALPASYHTSISFHCP
jgi:hypothetical protein